MPLFSPAVLVAIVAAATGPAADPPPGAVCPSGDAPTGALGALKHTSRLRSLDVVNGHGVLTVEDVYENDTLGAAALELSLTGTGVVRAASIEEPGFAPRAARLDDVGAATGAFEGFRAALTHGVASDEAVNGAGRAALLVTHDGYETGATISVAMACSVRSVIVRVEVLVPSVPIDGAWQFSLPAAPDEGVSDRIVVDSDKPIRAFLEGDSMQPGEERDVSTSMDEAAADTVTVTVLPLSGRRLRTRGYALRIDPTTLEAENEGQAGQAPDEAPDPHAEEALADEDPVAPVVVARAELDLPRPLSSAPAGLRIVFVIDNSVSVHDKGVAKALQVMHAVLDEAPPDARFAVVTAARKPRVVVAPWQARDERDIPPIGIENGSDVLGALAKARAIASDLESDGSEVPRIIAISDMQLRVVDTDARVAAGFGGKDAALTHMVVVADGDIEQPFLWARAFAADEPRAAGPERTGGIWIDAGDEDESALFPHLIAPTRIDLPRVVLGGVDVTANEWETVHDDGDGDGAAASASLCVVRSPRDEEPWADDAALPERLHAGSGLRVDVVLPDTHPAFVRFAKARGGRGELRIGGWLWAKRFDERVERDESLLGLAAVNEIGRTLDDDLVRTIARRAQTVSHVTALVEVPGFRPAESDGALWGTSGGTTCGCGCRGLSGRGSSGCGIGIADDLRERETLEELLREDARACLVSRAIIDVEFGDLEILDVTERAGGACVVERFWQRRLDLVTDRVPGAFQGHREMTIGSDAH